MAPKYRIGIAILLLIMAIPVAGYALCEVTLQWDANTPAPDGYFVFGRAEGQNYNYDEPWWSGDDTFTQCTIDELDEKTTYYFVVRAYEDDDMSGDSNEVSFTHSDSDTSSLTTETNASSIGGGSGSGCFIQSLLGFAFN